MKYNIIAILFIMLLSSSCAMRSGHYVKSTNGQWTFVKENHGFMHGFFNPRVDDTDFDYADSGKFLWPVPSSKKVSSYFGARRGRHHDGIDIPAKTGSSIIASADGTVVHSGTMRGYGKVVVVKHPGGYHTIYAHNSSNIASKGQKVSQGEVIAKVGSSGRSSGPHLHFEVRKQNKVTNPAKYLEWVERSRLADRR
jgi:murein DD-endopeptidase MepM/ murein hydrolase activator NlpD